MRVKIHVLHIALLKITMTYPIYSFRSIIKLTCNVNFLENNQKILLYFFLNILLKNIVSKYAILNFYINLTPLGLHTLRSDIHTWQWYAHGPPKVHGLFTLYKNSRISVTTVISFIASSHIQPKSITT